VVAMMLQAAWLLDAQHQLTAKDFVFG